MINKQINMELYASYVYMAMACYFDRDDVALKGFSKRFADGSIEEREHAQKLINYQNMRGGRVVFQDVANPLLRNGTQPLMPLSANWNWNKPFTRHFWNSIRSLIPMAMLSFATSSRVNT